MTAPTPTPRGTPSGIMLENSYQVLITFGNNPTLCLWEKDVQPNGVDNGDPIDETTQHNEGLRTKAPRALNDITNGKTKVAYDPEMYDEAFTQCGKVTTVTYWLPDGSSLALYGYMKSFIPAGLSGDGTQPEADIEIVATNRDPITKEIELPVLTSAVGT